MKFICNWYLVLCLGGAAAGCGDDSVSKTTTSSASTSGAGAGSAGGMSASSSSGQGGAGGMAPTGPFVFTSSTVHSGDAMPNASDTCNALASAAGLSGSYTAWFSSNGSDAIDQVVGDGPWYRTDGAMVFPDRSSLASGPAVPINRDEAGVELDPSPIFTGTAETGVATGVDCLVWTSYYDKDDATVGDNGSTGADWTAKESIPCGTPRRFYCFQDTP